MMRLKRLLAVASTSCIAATALTAGAVVVATPAQASTWDCTNYLSLQGYSVGAKLTDACAQGARGGPGNYAICLYELDRAGVNKERVRINACDLADN